MELASPNDKMQLLLTSAEPAIGAQQHLLLCIGSNVFTSDGNKGTAYVLNKHLSVDLRASET